MTTMAAERSAKTAMTAASAEFEAAASGTPVIAAAAAIGLAWDQERGRIVVELFSVDVDDETDENSLVQVLLTPTMARDFSARAELVVASGRPACPACGQPLDPSGHICPRANGYRGPLFT